MRRRRKEKRRLQIDNNNTGSDAFERRSLLRARTVSSNLIFLHAAKVCIKMLYAFVEKSFANLSRTKHE